MLLLFNFLCGLLIETATANRPIYDLEDADVLFHNFTTHYGKYYGSEQEKQKRLDIFKKNLQEINEKNSKNGAVFAINSFADLSTEEFRAQYTCFVQGLDHKCRIITDNDVNTNDAPASFNWVEQGAVTPVKNQAQCGSCWAFGTIGSIEGQYFLKHKELKTFSEQELVDCSKSNKGCRGGFPASAMTDLIDIGGVQESSTYPYEARDNSCRFDKRNAAAQVSGCKSYRLQNEDKLKEALAKTGPIVLGVNGQAIQSYHGGIMTIDYCASEPITHAVLLVGYGTDNGVDYWLIKNSWDTRFGEQGYFRIQRGQNVCGLMNEGMASAEIA